MAASDDEYDRVMKLLDVGMAALKSGDGDGTIMALNAATEAAKRMPKRLPNVICLSGPKESSGA